MSAAGPLPERGPDEGLKLIEHEQPIEFVDVEPTVLSTVCAVCGGECGDAAEQLAEALRDLLAHIEEEGEGPIAIEKAHAALAAFSAPRTPEGTRDE